RLHWSHNLTKPLPVVRHAAPVDCKLVWYLGDGTVFIRLDIALINCGWRRRVSQLAGFCKCWCPACTGKHAQRNGRLQRIFERHQTCAHGRRAAITRDLARELRSLRHKCSFSTRSLSTWVMLFDDERQDQSPIVYARFICAHVRRPFRGTRLYALSRTHLHKGSRSTVFPLG